MKPIEWVELWRPTGPAELDLVRASGWTAWPPRLPEQPIFYPVLNRDYATRIARDWNVKHSGRGYVTRFFVRKDFLDRYEVHQAGGSTILEYWIPAEDLAEFNANMGSIQVVEEFGPPPAPMTDAELAAIRDRASAATPGPWYDRLIDDAWFSSMVAVSITKGTDDPTADEAEWPQDASTMIAGTLIQHPNRYIDIADGRWDENAAFIADARTTVPRLLAEIARLRDLLGDPIDWAAGGSDT